MGIRRLADTRDRPAPICPVTLAAIAHPTMLEPAGQSVHTPFPGGFASPPASCSLPSHATSPDFVDAAACSHPACPTSAHPARVTADQAAFLHAPDFTIICGQGVPASVCREYTLTHARVYLVCSLHLESNTLQLNLGYPHLVPLLCSTSWDHITQSPSISIPDHQDFKILELERRLSVRSTCCACGRPGSGSQHLHSSSQLSPTQCTNIHTS